ncbi:hypothetical protein [Escherichia coli]|uniref:hypothetical protein n=1 Tax=Escherichia coli TaxID=562 RepID=UPI003892C748
MSIKNDGHYFCRAGGNRPDGLNEPVTEKELKRKDKALAEAAALLILREKFNALWDNSEEDCPLSWSGVKLFLLSTRPLSTAPGKVRLVGVSVFLFGHFSAGLMATPSPRTEDPIL